jgi:hypothetical protein
VRKRCPGGGKGRSRSGNRLRTLFEHGDQLPHRGVRDLSRCAGCEQAAKSCTRHSYDNEGLQVLFPVNPDTRDAVPALHLAVEHLKSPFSNERGNQIHVIPQNQNSYSVRAPVPGREFGKRGQDRVEER